MLLSINEYQRLTGKERTLLDVVSGWDGAAFEFEPPTLGRISRPADLD